MGTLTFPTCCGLPIQCPSPCPYIPAVPLYVKNTAPQGFEPAKLSVVNGVFTGYAPSYLSSINYFSFFKLTLACTSVFSNPALDKFGLLCTDYHGCGQSGDLGNSYILYDLNRTPVSYVTSCDPFVASFPGPQASFDIDTIPIDILPVGDGPWNNTLNVRVNLGGIFGAFYNGTYLLTRLSALVWSATVGTGSSQTILLFGVLTAPYSDGVCFGVSIPSFNNNCQQVNGTAKCADATYFPLSITFNNPTATGQIVVYS